MGFNLPLYHGFGADEIVRVAPVAHQRVDCPVNSLFAFMTRSFVERCIVEGSLLPDKSAAFEVFGKCLRMVNRSRTEGHAAATLATLESCWKGQSVTLQGIAYQLACVKMLTRIGLHAKVGEMLFGRCGRAAGCQSRTHVFMRYAA